jgi:hypothetical protein
MGRFANVLGSSVGVVLGLTALLSMARGQSPPAPSPPEAPTYPTSSSPSLFSIDAATPKITIWYQLGRYAKHHFPVGEGRPGRNDKIVINTTANWPSFPVADVKLSLPFGKAKALVTYTIHGARFSNHQYTVPRERLIGFAKWVIEQVEAIKHGYDADTPIPTVKDVTVTIIPRVNDPNAQPLEFSVDGSFEVDFQQFLLSGWDREATPQATIPFKPLAPAKSTPTSEKPKSPPSPANEYAGEPPSATVDRSAQQSSDMKLEPPDIVAPAAPPSPPSPR